MSKGLSVYCCVLLLLLLPTANVGNNTTTRDSPPTPPSIKHDIQIALLIFNCICCVIALPANVSIICKLFLRELLLLMNNFKNMKSRHILLLSTVLSGICVTFSCNFVALILWQPGDDDEAALKTQYQL